MGPMYLKNLVETLSRGDQQDLLKLAADSIEMGLKGTQLELDLVVYSRALRDPGASFVTINVRDQLRGCIGSLEIKRALAIDHRVRCGGPRSASESSAGCRRGRNRAPRRR